jgi:YHS domain-containing protein
MRVQQPECDLVKRRLSRADLRQHIDAVAVLLDHPRNAAHLAFDPARRVSAWSLVAEEQAREHARQADAGHRHNSAGGELSWRQRLTSIEAWSDVAHNFRNDWAMLWKEITIGFLLAGFIGLLRNDFFNGLFIHNANHALRTTENVILGPIVAVLSFVCSIGNVPLAAVLWSGEISFGGVVAFLLADLIVTNVIGLLVFATLIGLTVRRGATDPVCGMKVDRDKAIRMDVAGETHYFCSQHCLHAYELDSADHGHGSTHETGARHPH